MISYRLLTQNLLILLIITMALSIDTSVTVVNLNQKWTMQMSNITTPKEKQLNGITFETNLPTTVHLDLLKHNKIQDPFYRNNVANLNWISQSNVKYSKKFIVQQSNLKRACEIVFHGIDTYATVKLNGYEIIKAKNAFIRYTARVQKYLKAQNLLQVQISSATPFDSAGQGKNPMPFKYAHTRKACYQYSWDWAPQLITMGLWKDVELRFFDQIRIDYVWARNRIISQENATINFATKLELNLFRDDQLSQGYAIVVYLKNQKLNSVQVHGQTAYVDVHIQNPQFWWPNGIGQPYIYDFQVKLQKQGQVVDFRKIPYGIRTAELNLQNKQFQVKINGNPVYCKGANYVPLDMLHPRIYNKQFQTNKTYTINKLFQDIVESNFNMIRIWGGGQYEHDQFLQLASRKGIMIFYDFMFSDSIYPSDPDFLQNVQQEIKQQIRRTRNYPALTLWSGNNEILQGVKDWGWSSPKYTQDYQKLFEKLIRRVVKIQNPDIDYIPSSPIYGVGNYGFDKGGDFHYWSVWAGGSSFQSYQGAVGPFNSQFGTQALPVWHSIKEFTLQEDRKYQSNTFLSHERHNSQFGTLRNYMNMYMKPSKNFQNQAYLSSVVQAFGIEIAIKAQRTAKPKSYGTLYWQLNDAWPAISWSSIDYYGRWKALQYMAKRSYTNIAIFGFVNGIMAVNDNLYTAQTVAKMYVIQFDGNVLYSEQKNVVLDADSSTIVFHYNTKQKHADKIRKLVLYTEIYYKQKKQMSSTQYFVHYKELQLPKANLKVKYNLQQNQLVLSSDMLIKNLFVDYREHYVHFCDNYFDVVPGHPVTITLQKTYNLGNIKSGLIFRSVRDATMPQQIQVSVI